MIAGGRIRFAGDTGASGNPAIRQFSVDLLVVDTLIERTLGEGMRLSSSARPEVRRVSFIDGGGIPVNFAPLAALPGFTDNLAIGNTLGDYIRVGTAGLSGDVVIGRHNSLNSNGVFVVANNVNIFAGSTLDLRQGTVFKT